MKKIVTFFVFVVLTFCFLLPNVTAKKFIEEHSMKNYFEIYYENKANKLYTSFYKFTDEEGKKYYNITPRKIFFQKQEYQLVSTDISKEILSLYSKILYFGDGYQGVSSDLYYFATQYLLIQSMPNYHIRVVNTSFQTDTVLDGAIEEIQKRMDTHTFGLTDFTTSEKEYIIKDAYIVNHFLVTGENIDVFYDKEEIKVTFLQEQEEYLLHFQPKKTCEDYSVWQNNDGVQYLHMDLVCEEAREIKIYYERKEEQGPLEDLEGQEPSDSVNKEDSSISNGEQVTLDNPTMDIYEISVPDTAKYRLDWLFWLLFLGNVYYVFKK